LIAREGLTPEAALARIHAQLPLESKLPLADILIDNEGAPADLARQVRYPHCAPLIACSGPCMLACGLTCATCTQCRLLHMAGATVAQAALPGRLLLAASLLVMGSFFNARLSFCAGGGCGSSVEEQSQTVALAVITAISFVRPLASWPACLQSGVKWERTNTEEVACVLLSVTSWSVGGRKITNDKSQVVLGAESHMSTTHKARHRQKRLHVCVNSMPRNACCASAGRS
jgi:hypothetical protein